MTSYLADTDVIIDHLGGRADVDRLVSVEPASIFVSIISVAELYEGVYRHTDQEHPRRGLDSFLLDVTVLNVDAEIARIFGKLRASLRRTGELIDNFDLLIAATCLRHGLTLLTDNIRHFKRIPGLNIA